MFVDVHSHVVPSGDDGVSSIAEGLELCREAGRRGTAVLFATPHVWPLEGLTAERERDVRAAYDEMAPHAQEFDLDLRLGFELSPAPWLLDEDPHRYRLGELPAVLMELPFSGSLTLAEQLAIHIETAGLLPLIAHPERAAAVLEQPNRARSLRERGWPLQVNATSLLGYHGDEGRALAWELLEHGVADLVASDGHRRARPPFLDEAFSEACTRMGPEKARALFDGNVLGIEISARGLGPDTSAARDGLDVAERS